MKNKIIPKKVTFNWEMKSKTSNKIPADGSAPEQITGEYLYPGLLPRPFISRYEDLPEENFVRECYKELYELVSTTTMNPEYDAPSGAVFTGTPGIGKSIFLIYFLWLFLSDPRFPDKRFAVEFKQDIYFVFEPVNGTSNTFNMYRVTDDDFPFHEFLLLCDHDDTTSPYRKGKWTFVFSSPNEIRFKEFAKRSNTKTFYMPTWNHDELFYWKPNENEWKESFEKVGGVPRLLRLPPQTLDKKINAKMSYKGLAVSKVIMTSQGGTIDSEINHLLCHANPKRDPNTGKWNYESYTTTPASSYMYTILVEKFLNDNNQETISMMKSGAGAAKRYYGAIEAGKLFQRLLVRDPPLANMKIEAIALEGVNAGKKCTFVLPEIEEVKPTTQEWNKLKLVAGKLYTPIETNFPSADQFYLESVISTDGTKSEKSKCKIVCLQHTLACDHPIKVSGLSKIKERAEECGFDVENEIAFIFETPEKGLVKAAQPFVDTKSNSKELPKGMTVVQYECAVFDQKSGWPKANKKANKK